MRVQTLRPDWKTVKFGDIAENVAVRVEPAEARTSVYVGLEHLDPETIHLRKWGHPSDVTGQKLAFKKGDVIFGRRRAYQRKLAVAEFDGICSAHAMVIRAKPEMILPEFLPFFLQSDLFMRRAVEISVGSLSPTINWKTLRVQEFPLPPIEEQKRMADILWAADEMVERWYAVLECQRTLLDVLLKKLYPCSILSTRLEKPNGSYPVARLGDHAEVFSGGTPSRKNAAFWNGDIPWVKTAEVKYYDIRDTEKQITELGLKQSSAKMVPADAVLVAMYGQGPTRGRVGYTATESAINQACAAIVPKQGTLRPRFIYYYLKKEYEEIRKLARGATQPNINVGMVKDFRFPLFALEKQRSVEQVVASVESRILATEEHIRNTKQTAKRIADSVAEGDV